MAGNEDRKAELIAQLARARQQIDASGSKVRRDLDVGARIRSSFQRHTFAWLSGGLIAGAVLVAVFRRPRVASPAGKKHRDETMKKAGAAGLLVAGTKIAFDAFRPMLIKWVIGRATPFAEKMMSRYTGRHERSHDDWR
jgi:hypothetical protein